jgi:hypothetical protein
VNIDEAKQVVTKIQLGDNRQVDRLVLMEWFEYLADLELVDAIAAVREHRRTSDAYLMPVHVVRLALEAKQNREWDEQQRQLQVEAPPLTEADRAERRQLLNELFPDIFKAEVGDSE